MGSSVIEGGVVQARQVGIGTFALASGAILYGAAALLRRRGGART
jgi:hypothetical protein